MDTLLAVYESPSNDFAGLVLKKSNDDCGSAGGKGSCLKLRVKAGVTYAIQVSGYGGAVGSVKLSLSFTQF